MSTVISVTAGYLWGEAGDFKSILASIWENEFLVKSWNCAIWWALHALYARPIFLLFPRCLLLAAVRNKLLGRRTLGLTQHS